MSFHGEVGRDAGAPARCDAEGPLTAAELPMTYHSVQYESDTGRDEASEARWWWSRSVLLADRSRLWRCSPS